MSEIVCRSCGARNPTQSKYCNKCGEDLRSGTSQLCPSCDQSNPIELLYCDHCGTLLAEDALLDADDDAEDQPQPDSRSKPFSLPSRAPGQTGDLDVSGELPGWLKTGDVEQAQDRQPDEEAPDWLASARSSDDEWEDAEAPTLDELSGSHAPSDDLPTWLLEDDAGNAIFDSEKDTNELFKEGKARQDAGEGEEGAESQEALPDWLEGLSPPGTGPLPFVSEEDAESSEGAAAADAGAGDEPGAAGGPVGDATSELQSWLSAMEEEAGEAAEPEPGEAPSSQEQTQAQADEGIADWVQAFQTNAGDEADAAPPEGEQAEDDFARWLTGEELGEEPADREQVDVQSMDDEDFQRWLADAQGEDAEPDSIEVEGREEAATPQTPADEAAAGAADDDAPDWLDMPEDEFFAEDDVPSSADPESAAAPDWLAEFEEDDLAPVDDLLAADEDDQWTPPADEPATAAAPGEDDALLATDADAGEEMTEEDFLDWLATLDEGGPAATVGAEQAAAAGDEAAPDDVVQEVDEGDEAADQPLQEPAGDEPAAQLPSWLGELADSDAEPAEEEQPGDLPEWLQTAPSSGDAGPLPYLETEGKEEETVEAQREAADPVPEPEAEEEADEELPEWLTGVSAEFDVGAQAAAETKSDEPPAPAPTDQAAGPEEGEEQPEQVAAFEELDFADVSLDPDAADDLVPTEDLPDWFSDVMADIETEGAADSRPAGPAELANVPPQLAADELPEWLDSPFSDAPDAEPTPLEEIPEWLQPPAAAGQEAIAEDEELLSLGASESSDEWAELLEALPPPEQGQDTPRLSQAEIPEWLQALKPQALRADSEAAPTEPEESEGPLAGLRGVIGVAPVMARPRLAERTEPDLLAHEQEQQVALLQQLARAETRPVSHAALPERRAAVAPALRILLAILLLATLFAGLLFSETIAQLLPLARPESAAEAARLIDEAAGEPVIVAIEYTPALSGALGNDARAALARLADNGSEALLVSQSAAGALLAQQAAADVPDLQSVNVGYIPGGAAGLRSLAGCLDDGQPCESLFGRPLAPSDSAALSDAALVIVFSGDRDRLIDWVEQVQTTTAVSMLAFVTEAIAPVAAPYDSSQQLSAVASGASPALASTAQPLSAQETAVMLGRWLAVATILLGAIYYLVAGPTDKRQARTDE